MSVLSIIIPVYKAEQYIERCVNSVLDQTLADIEIILVDDGSPDRCPDICDEFAACDNRVRVIHQKNAGVAAARNTGMKYAKGKYIAFVDSDDYIKKNMYEAMIRCADENDCDVVMCDCLKDFGNQKELYTHGIRPGYYSRKQIESEYFSNLLIMPNVEYPPTISNWLLVFKKSLCESQNIKYIEGVRYSEDLIFGAELLYYANSFFYLKNEPYYYYNCVNQFSATHTFVDDKWDDYKKLYLYATKAFPDMSLRKQIDIMLLFFVYNATGDILKNNELTTAKKRNLLSKILDDDDVRKMLKNINVAQLSIPLKQKLITYCFKTKIGRGVLINYYERNCLRTDRGFYA